MTDHPLTESRVEKLWNANCLTSFWANLGISNKVETAAAMRTSYSVGREDALTQSPDELSVRTILGVPDTYGAPNHDANSIRAGDFVVQVDKDRRVRGGIAHSQDRDGDWYDEIGRSLTWACVRADRPDAVTVWSAPAEVAELPTEDGAVIVPADGHEYIQTNEGIANALVHLGGKWYGGAFQIEPEDITPDTWKVARND